MLYKNKMLVVDDDAITRNITKLVFKDNFAVLEAANGQEALDLLNQNRNDIVFIICDVSMPIMDGFTFLKEKNKFIYNNGIPVIMITSVGDDQIRSQAIALGAADFVDKPLDPKVVRLRVNNVLSNYGIGYAYNDSLQREFLDLINNQLRGGILSVYDAEDYPIHYVSESLATHLGYKNAAEMIEHLDGKWKNILTPDAFTRAERNVKAQLAEKSEFIHEYQLRKKDGDYIWVRENGKYSGDSVDMKKLVALCVDITDTKIAEEKARYNEQLAVLALKSTSTSIWEYDFATKSIIQGQHSIEMHGFDALIPNVPESLIESGSVHPESVQDFLNMYDKLWQGAENAEGIFKVRNLDKTSYRYEHIHYTNTFDKDGKPYRAIGISKDVTQQQNMIARYQRQLDFNKTLSPDIFSTARLNITQCTIEEIHTDINEDRDLVQNATFDSLPAAVARLPYRDAAAVTYFKTLNERTVLDAYRSGERVLTYQFVRQVNGSPTWVRFEMHMMEDPNNNDLLAFVYFRNIDKQHREVERLKELASRDQMTGLYNHDATIDAIKQCMAEDMVQNHALFVIDVNKFKTINDCYGHINGDFVLTQVAKRIQAVCRGDDIVGRVGGDEFMVFIKNLPSKAAVKKKAEELADATHFTYGDTNIDVLCSIGVALYSGQNGGFSALYKKADQAMYAAKKSSGLRYVIAWI